MLKRTGAGISLNAGAGNMAGHGPQDTELNRRVSWGSVIAGVVTVTAVSMLLTTLGSGLGLALLSPASDDVVNGADKAVLAWSLVSVVLSLACGGFVSGRLAGTDGTIHGFLSWATSLLVASVLGFAAAGGILHMAGSAVSATASFAGSAVSGLGSVAVKRPEQQLMSGKILLPDLDSTLRLQKSRQISW